MKIIFSTYETKEIGGSYLRSFLIAKNLVKLGHEVTLWTSAKKISLKARITNESGVRVIESIGLFPYSFRKSGYDFLDLIFRSVFILFSQCDVIHSFNHRPAATFPAFLKRIFFSKVKWFVDWADLWGKGGIADRRNGFFSFLIKFIDHYSEYFFIKIAYAITPISDDLMRKAIKIRGDNSRVFFLGVGADVESIQPLKKNYSRKKLRLPLMDKILIYLYVGTYDEKLLANTFIELCKLREDVKLVLLGPFLPIFEKLILNHKSLDKKILRKGIIPRHELPYYLASGDLMMLPFTNKEINLGKFPNKIGDYLAAGRPIVSNPTGEVLKILKMKKVGSLFPEDPKEFAKGISNLLDDPIKMSRFGKNSRLLAKRLSWLNIAKQLETFYIK